MEVLWKYYRDTIERTIDYYGCGLWMYYGSTMDVLWRYYGDTIE